MLLSLCIAEAVFLAGAGFVTYSVEGENYSEIWRWQVFPRHIKLFFIVFMGSMMMTLIVAAFIAGGALDMLTTSPLVAVAAALTAYLWWAISNGWKVVGQKHPQG